MNKPHRIYVVDDDPAVLAGICRLLRSAGYEPRPFASAREFMNEFREDAHGCLLLDVSMPEISGMDLHRWLARLESALPVIFMTGHGDIPTSVEAMKGGAVDFLMKPVNETALFKAVEEAFRRERGVREWRAQRDEIQARLATLTPREREVLEHIVAGELNKQVAAQLGTVEKTIKVHRARVMEKMGVQSLAELARLAERIGIGLPIPLPKRTPPNLSAQ